MPHSPCEDRNKDNSITEEVDQVTSAISRCNENVQLKRAQLDKNERMIRDIEYEVRRGGELGHQNWSICGKTPPSHDSDPLPCILQMSLLVVNMDLLNEAHSRVTDLTGRLKAKRDEAARNELEEAVKAERTALEGIQTRVAALRQVDPRTHLLFLKCSLSVHDIANVSHGHHQHHRSESVCLLPAML